VNVYEKLVMMGAYLRSDKKEVRESLEGVYKLCPKLKERRNQKGGTLGISDRAYVLESGRIALSGKAKELIQYDQRKEAYVGL
jgi:branched-chain amino acid transport system ATP-binding protein